MKSSTLRTIVISVTVLIVLIMGVQLYWVSKTYRLEEKEFNIKVNSALRSVVEAIRFSHKDTSPFAGVITQPLHDYFIADTKYPADSSQVEFLLKKAIEEYNIFTNFKFGIYHTTSRKLTHIRYIPSGQTAPDPGTTLPLFHRPYNYIGVLFPNRESFIIHQMGFWIFSTILLLLVIIGFGITIFKLFRQKQLSEIQKDFINNMTHEFRTPIATIQLSTEVLKNNQGIQANQRLFQYASIIENEANHLENQVDRVLQVARQENHSLHLEKTPVDVHEVIGQTVHDFENSIHQKGGRFRLELHATRPVIIADRLHFTNILFNLADNAIKYAPCPLVVFRTFDHHQGITIRVEDNGPGIPRKYQKFLFTKFFRIPTGNLHEVKGFGLGLNYVKLYTNSFGGTIRVQSEPGKGSNFILNFPRSSVIA
jgi:two-component system phosphate regulon sensor histidine kinase PhoR